MPSVMRRVLIVSSFLYKLTYNVQIEIGSNEELTENEWSFDLVPYQYGNSPILTLDQFLYLFHIFISFDYRFSVDMVRSSFRYWNQIFFGGNYVGILLGNLGY